MGQQHRYLVVITGADTPTGLTTARSLAGYPVEVWGVATRTELATCRSRFWNRVIAGSPNPNDQLDLIIAESEKWIGEKPLLLFSQDDLVTAASARREELERSFILTLPSPEHTERLMDKTKFHDWACVNTVDVPASVVVSTPKELRDAVATMRYPWILKPLVRTARWDGVNPSKKFYYISSQTDYENLPAHEQVFLYSESYLVQEWIPGGDEEVYFCLFSIDDQGNVLDEFLGRKYWQWPIGGGSTAICTNWTDDSLRRKARDIVLRGGMRGLGSIEFKRHKETGHYLVTEPTVGRNDYQSYSGVIAGHNMTGALVEHTFQLSLKKNKKERMIIWIDELSTYRRIKSQENFTYDLNYLYRLYLFRRSGFLVFIWRDPRPFFSLLSSVLKKRFKIF